MYKCTNNPNHKYPNNTADGFCPERECYGLGYLIEERHISVSPKLIISLWQKCKLRKECSKQIIIAVLVIVISLLTLGGGIIVRQNGTIPVFTQHPTLTPTRYLTPTVALTRLPTPTEPVTTQSPTPTSTKLPQLATYQVEAGDTLWDIAQRFYGDGTKWRLIANANGIDNPRRLQVGTVLIIPTQP